MRHGPRLLHLCGCQLSHLLRMLLVQQGCLLLLLAQLRARCLQGAGTLEMLACEIMAQKWCLWAIETACSGFPCQAHARVVAGADRLLK